jgi:hypothetical protein
MKLTLLDSEVPVHIRTIIEMQRPALPIVLVNGKVTPIGRIALDRITTEIKKVL